MELEDTIPLMLSDDYKDRFKAEYYQLCIRCKKLEKLYKKFEASELPFKPAAPMQTFFIQLPLMLKYKKVLEARALTEEIDLEV